MHEKLIDSLKAPLHIILIALVGLIVYSNTLDFPFQLDDEWNIVNNPALRDFGYFLHPEESKELTTGLRLSSRIVGFLSFYLNYSVHGLDVTGYHIANIAVHLANALLVYWLVVITFRTPFFSAAAQQRNSAAVALFTALLFVSHPVQTQAVTYIVQRLASLAAMFYLGSIVLYARWRMGSGSGDVGGGAHRVLLFYFLSLLSALLAMKTKEIAFTLPVAIAAYEFIFFREALRKRVLYILPFLLTMLVIPLSLIDIGKPLGEVLSDASETARLQTSLSRAEYLFTEFRVMATYIRLLFLPVNQNLDYDYPIYESILDPNVFLSFILLLSIVGIGFFLLRVGHRLPAFGIFWFFLTLSVESSVIPIKDVIFEHRLYLPSVGAFMAIGAGAFYVFGALRGKRARAAFTTFLVLLLLSLTVAAYARNDVWRDSITLWEDVVNKSPGNARGHYNLGIYYNAEGSTEKAIGHYRTAIGLKHPKAYNNLGNIYAAKGMMDEAIEQYLFAISLYPRKGWIYSEHYNLGNAYLKKGLPDKAVEHFQTALRIKPDYFKAYSSMGTAYLKLGLMEKAVDSFRAALKIKPDYAEAYENLKALGQGDGS